MKAQKIAYVDLTTEKIEYQDITNELRKGYIGGGGINTKILYDSEAMYFDALSEKNTLVFGAGCLVGNGVMAGNRMVLSAKSPVTDMFGDTNVGGNFPVLMRKAGIDNLVFQGKAKEPVYVLLKGNGNIEIHSAKDIWGKYTDETTDILTQRHGEKSEVACIGTAGENLIRFANVMMSKNHAAGRMGLGCVMGSKNLKAVVIEFSVRKMLPGDQELFDEIRFKWLKNCMKSMSTALGKVYGTLFLLEINMKGKHLPAKNAMQGEADDEYNILPDMFKVKNQIKKTACYSCPVGCSKKYEVREGRFKGEKGERIEFGAAVSTGPYIGIYDWGDIIHLKLLCDYMGVDTIEFAASVGLILECSEKGLIPERLSEGRTFHFGNVDDVEFLMNKMCKREGIGNYIAEGAYRAAQALNCEDYAFCVSKSSTGLCSNSRLVRSLGYLTSTRGGDHLKSFAFTMQNGGYFVAKHLFKIKHAKKQLGTTDKNGRVLWWHENYKNIVDSIGVCLFAIQGLPGMGCGLYDDFAKIIGALYGFEWTELDVLKASERIYQLQNSFNVNCGRTIDDYVWPSRKKEEGIKDEYIDATVFDCRDADGMLPEYFAYRGLNNGIPSIEKFEELGLDSYIERAGCVHSENAKKFDEILQEVNIVIHFNFFDQIYSRFSNWFMGKMLWKKSEKTQNMIKKKISKKA